MEHYNNTQLLEEDIEYRPAKDREPTKILYLYNEHNQKLKELLGMKYSSCSYVYNEMGLIEIKTEEGEFFSFPEKISYSYEF